MSEKKKVKKPYAVKPTLYAACTAGGLLCQIVIKSSSGTLKAQNGEEGWLAITAKQWYVLTGFSRSQYNDALRVLKVKGLIESDRRKLSWADPAAITWVRLKDEVKSQIAEITSRNPISAFREIMEQSIPENSETMLPMISASADIVSAAISGEAATLNINEIVSNEIVSNENNFNVVIAGAKTKTKATQLSSKKEVLGKKSNEYDWYVGTMKEIYGCANCAYEAYTAEHCEQLKSVLKYLEDDPSGYHQYCPNREHAGIQALTVCIENWTYFIQYAVDYYKAFNMPAQPQLWALVKQIKVIPDFFKLAFLYNLILKECEKAGYPEPEISRVIEFYKNGKWAGTQEMEEKIKMVNIDMFLEEDTAFVMKNKIKIKKKE